MLTLHREKFGSQNGQTIVWLHGFLGSGSDWLPFISLLDDYHHVLVDLPGHGESGLPVATGHQGFNESVTALEELIKAECSQPPIVVGYSMGGRLALSLSVDKPGLLATLVVVSASPGIADPEDGANRRQWDHDLGQRLMATPQKEFLEAWYGQELFRTLSSQPELLEDLINARLNIDLDNVSHSLASTGAGVMPFIGDRIQNLKVPLLYLTGSEDRKYSQIGHELASMNTGIHLEILPGVSHAAHIEKPLEFINILKTFLQSIQGGL